MSIEFVDELPEPQWNRRSPASERINCEFASALRGEPMRWAKWPNSRRSSSSSLRSLASAVNNSSRIAPSALRSGEFEAATRGDVMYVRFIGETAV